MTFSRHSFSIAATPARRGRIALAWYVDFLFYSVFSAAISYFANWTFGTSWIAEIAGFIVLRTAGGFLLETPGMMLLGIRRDSTRNVGPLASESWLTMLIGTLFLLDGVMNCVRWTENSQIYPDFGIVPDPVTEVALSLAWGLSMIAAGGLLLRMQREGFWLALLIVVLGIVSVALSWPMWGDVLAQEAVARRAAQGLSVRNGEIAFVQAFVPTVIVVCNIVVLGLLAVIWRRYRA